MDSNSICFAMTLPSSLSLKSPQMFDDSKSCQSKSTEESTNFIDFQQFKKASNGSCSTSGDNHESVQNFAKQPKKTKIIQKQKNLNKQSQKKSNIESHPQFNLKPSICIQNQNPRVRNGKDEQNLLSKTVQKKATGARSHSFASVFDWMMEIASIMKLSRNVLYRGCNILYESYKKDEKVLENSSVEKYVCASLNISAKLESSSSDFLQELFQINKKRIPKQSISDAQFSIYQILNWKLPLHSLVSEQVSQVFSKWNGYLQRCQKLGLIRPDTRERLSLCMEFNEQHTIKNKIYGEIIYLLDMQLLNQPKKYMHTNVIEGMEKHFYGPIVIAMYSVFTIHLGDHQNKQKYFMNLFVGFYRDGLQMPAVEIDRLAKEIQLSFMIFTFGVQLSKIPLDKEWMQAVHKDIVTYLPVNVLSKTKQ